MGEITNKNDTDDILVSNQRSRNLLVIPSTLLLPFFMSVVSSSLMVLSGVG